MAEASSSSFAPEAPWTRRSGIFSISTRPAGSSPSRRERLAVSRAQSRCPVLLTESASTAVIAQSIAIRVVGSSRVNSRRSLATRSAATRSRSSTAAHHAGQVSRQAWTAWVRHQGRVPISEWAVPASCHLCSIVHEHADRRRRTIWASASSLFVQVAVDPSGSR